MKPLGIILLLFSILSLIFFDILFLKFLSSAIIFIGIYYLFYRGFLFFNRKQIYLKLLSNFKISDGNSIRLVFEIINFPIHFIGFFSFLSFSISNNSLNNQLSKKVFSIIEEISQISDRRDKKRFFIDLNFMFYGYDYFKDFSIYIDDIFGFFRVKLKIDYTTKLFFEPDFYNKIIMKNDITNIGDKILKSIIKINSNDYYESRKYYPGDDIRKINWKVFAHSSELHIREIEKSEPFSKTISIIFAPYSKSIKEYEFLSSLFYFTLIELLSKGFKAKIQTPLELIFIENYDNGVLKLKELLNSSYSSIKNVNIIDNKIDRPILFASLEEYEILLEKNLNHINHSIVSYNHNEENISTILSSIFKIDNHHFLATELFDKYKKISENKKVDKKLSVIKKISYERNIKLELYTFNCVKVNNVSSMN